MEAQYPLEKTRNIGIMAHIDAGKTTTTERDVLVALDYDRLQRERCCGQFALDQGQRSAVGLR